MLIGSSLQLSTCSAESQNDARYVVVGVLTTRSTGFILIHEQKPKVDPARGAATWLPPLHS